MIDSSSKARGTQGAILLVFSDGIKYSIFGHLKHPLPNTN